MSYCFTAQFKNLNLNGSSAVVRHNTRLWFNKDTLPSLTEGICVGAVVGLNPGSAIGPANTSIDVVADCDPTMQRILKTFEIAYELKNNAIPKKAYIQLLNLFYLREKHAPTATRIKDQNSDVLQLHQDPAESRIYPFLWLAWGNAGRDEDMTFFLRNRQEKCCWVGADLTSHFDRPVHAWQVRHPLCRCAGFSMYRNAEMIARMLG